MHLIVIGISILLFAVLCGAAIASALKAAAPAGERDVVMSALRGHALTSLGTGHRKAVREQLPDALDMIANSLTAGLTLPQAILRNLEHLPPDVASELAHVLYDTRLGFSVAGAFDNFAARLPTKEVMMIAIASKIGVAHGGKLHENYRMLSAVLRDNMAFENELRAMTTEGRMQAIVMSCLPAALIVILGAIRPELMAPLFTTAYGWATLATLAVMQMIAYVWIKKIVSIEV